MKALTIKQKLIFINLFSTLIIFSFASVIAKNAYDGYNNYNQTNKIIKVSLKLSSLLHELQKERGASTGYIVSKNNNFKLLVIAKQKLTDEIINELDEIYIKKFDLIDSLQAIREKVANNSISSEEIIIFYSALNSQIINTIVDFSNTPRDTEIRSFFNSLVVFITVKEKVGIEQAILANVFANNTFNLPQFEQVASLNSGQKALLEVFMKTTTTELKKQFEKTLQHKSFAEVQRMKTVALTKYQDIDIESVYWFNEVSLKIDELKFFESKITEEIIALSEHKSFTAKSEFILILTITLIVFFYTFLISYSIGKNIVNSYEKIKSTLKLINDSVIVSETDKQGIITHASKAFCDISGYTKEELIGQPHNILRHPDMKKETFANLWSTIKAHKIWSGEVKNKKKDGSFYWVSAVITPKYSATDDLIGYTAIRQDITDKKMVEELSITDGLTGLFNRRHFDNLFPQIINTSKRHHQLVCLMMLDVDFFKPYNDTYGHQKGDQVLIEISKTIQDLVKRAGDFAFRLGGEEFGIIFVAESTANAFIVAETLKKNIQNLQIPHEKNPDYKVITISIGIVCKEAQNVDNQETFYKEADDLLYKAKESGRNKIVTNKD